MQPVAAYGAFSPSVNGPTQPAVAIVAKTIAVMADVASVGTAWLAPYERERVESFRVEQARQAYLAAHWLVRQAAARLLSVAASDLRLAQHCPECGGEHGPPRIVGQEHIHVSLSHADQLVAAAAACVPVAIDVEEWCKLHMNDLLRGRVFSAAERRWLEELPVTERAHAATRVWTHKECRVKLGKLSLDDFGKCDLETELAGLALGEGTQRGVYLDGCRFTQWCSTSNAATMVVTCAGDVDVALCVPP
ncbi:MAG TPA: 4'-phosphopantetheinyl transferase superfamily protein [Aquabacterium sp.]|nr:4'-phosphopantetheinyl transferase superfamily protein [Aquabacterium sp.]